MFSPKPTKNHRSGPCPGRGCPTCREQRQRRNKSRRAHSTGGTRYAASRVLSAATAAPIASQAYCDDQAERAALEALTIAEEDGSLDLMPHTLFLDDDVLEALDGSGWLMVLPVVTQ
jgi:hypothetical protein